LCRRNIPKRLEKNFFSSPLQETFVVVAFAECYLPVVLSCYLYSCKIS